MQQLPAPEQATAVKIDSAADPSGRLLVVLTLRGDRSELSFILQDAAQTCQLISGLAQAQAANLAEKPAIAAIATPSGPHLVREA